MNILRVGLMCRVSTDEQALHGDSLQAQEDALVEYANNNNMKIHKVYRDEGFSARKPVLKRPAMLELLDDVKAGKLDMILFTKLDRWFRNIQEYYKIQEVLEKNKVVWKAILEDYNTSTADGRLKVNIMLSVAENEADRTSERIRFTFQSKVNRKESIFGVKTTPWGYATKEIDGVKRVVKDEETRDAVEFFFRIALTNSVRQAAVQTIAKYGIKKTYTKWFEISHSEIYTGTYKGVEGYCEPYITKEEHLRLLKPKQIRKAANDRIYLFTGLIKCPCCGAGTRARYATGWDREYNYYRCPNRVLKLCYQQDIPEAKIERYVKAHIKEELENYIMSVETAQPKKQKKKTDTAKLKEQLRRVNVSYQAGNMEDAEYLAETKKIKAMIEKASIEESQTTETNLDALKEFLNSDFETIYTSLEREEKQMLWRSVIDEIVVEGTDVVGIKFRG